MFLCNMTRIIAHLNQWVIENINTGFIFNIALIKFRKKSLPTLKIGIKLVMKLCSKRAKFLGFLH